MLFPGGRIHKSRTTPGRIFCALALVFAYVCAGFAPPGVVMSQETGGRYYPLTGFTLAPQFVAYFDAHGGVPVFGYPIAPAQQENGFLVQWTERERLEWHPENHGTQYEVLLGLLGSELTGEFAGARFTRAAGPSPGEQAGAAWFPETGFSVGEPFLSYWRDHGGIAMFGYPISTVHTAENGLTTQWFQRARFELHPDLPSAFRVSLGLLSREARALAMSERYELEVAPSSVPDTDLQIGLAQGGESEDPGFFDNVRRWGTELGGGLVRLDNIYNFYDIVRRTASGTIEYNWTKLDRVIDGITAMGKKPMICLSYMPETFSATGDSRVQPPADYGNWASIVAATVRHLNIERGLNIKYWEVWNEPNIWSFWKGSFPDYLKLYDVTVAAATAVDPSVKIGGPAFSHLEPMGITEFMAHEASLGAGGRVDFLSWHAYGGTPDEMAAQIRQARGIADLFPQFHPELIITEFNVLQGGQGDTSMNGSTDTVAGAISLVASVEAMMRERLDQAFLFELKDGQGPTTFWGRWGVLTYDGRPKPIYYALRALTNRPPGRLPVLVRSGHTDGRLGAMAFGDSANSTIVLWHKGTGPARVKLSLPSQFSHNSYTVALFDSAHNNPVLGGGSDLSPLGVRDAGDMVFDLQPNSLLIAAQVRP